MRSLVLVLCVVASVAYAQVAYAQEPTLSRVVAREPTTTTAPQAPATSPSPDFFHREELTGDWNGLRTKWKNKGVELASSLTQFYQGVSSGGTGTSSEYNGTAQATLNFDLGKLAGWNFWSAEFKAEVRFGGPLVTSTGTILTSLIAFTLLYGILAVFWYRLMHRYAIQGVADSEHDPSPDNPDNDPGTAHERPLSFAY